MREREGERVRQRKASRDGQGKELARKTEAREGMRHTERTREQRERERERDRERDRESEKQQKQKLASDRTASACSCWWHTRREAILMCKELSRPIGTTRGFVLRVVSLAYGTPFSCQIDVQIVRCREVKAAPYSAMVACASSPHLRLPLS